MTRLHPSAQADGLWYLAGAALVAVCAVLAVTTDPVDADLDRLDVAPITSPTLRNEMPAGWTP